MSATGESLDPLVVLSAWEVPAGATVERIARGTNNLIWRVRLPASHEGDATGTALAHRAYVLRLYQNAVDPRYLAAIAYEHRLLRELARQTLSFAVPAPIPARTGDTLVAVAVSPVSQPGASAVVALFPLIRGEHPPRGDPAVARLCGAALAELDIALARLPDLGPSPTARYGDLNRIHPLIPEPLALPDLLSALPADTARLRRIISEVAEQAPALYRALPQQVIHSDFGTGNVLLAGGRVAGVLDFEFAAPDLRAMDWAVGLLHSAIADVPPERRWDNVDAFGRAYAARLPLLPEEVRALPALLRLRRVVSVIHRAGRWRQGAASAGEVLDNLHDTLALDDWLRAGGDRLVDLLLAAQ